MEQQVVSPVQCALKSAPQSEIPVKCGGVHLLAIAQCVIEQSVYVSKYESEISLPISSFAMHSIFISIRSVPRVRIKASKQLNQVQGPYNKTLQVVQSISKAV